MRDRLRQRITLVWIALVAATLVSFELPGGGASLAGALVLAIAFVKTRYIMLEFMELRHAPLGLRLAAEGWPLVTGTAVIGFYWTGNL